LAGEVLFHRPGGEGGVKLHPPSRPVAVGWAPPPSLAALFAVLHPHRPMRPLLPLTLFALLLAVACDRPAAPDLPAAEAPPAAPSVVADSIVIEDSTLLFFVRYRYPRLRDAGPHTDAINRALADSARATVEAYRPEGPPPPERTYPFTTELDVTYDVHRLDDRLFSAVSTLFTYTGGAHPNTHSEVINYDLATGRPFALADLFRPGAAYLDTLSAHADRWVEGEAARIGGTRGDFWEEGWAPET